MKYDEQKLRAGEYAKRRNLILGDVLGYGQDGIVLATDVATAIKSFKYPLLYEKELAVYRRLSERHVNSVGDFAVPSLIDHHPELTVIQMEFVTPPYILDFASAGVDHDPLAKYDREQLAEFFQDWEELFGDDWPLVKKAYLSLKSIGICLADLNTSNIRVKAPTA